MPDYRSVRISSDTWRRLKQRALDDGTTLHKVLEQAVAAYLILAAPRKPKPLDMRTHVDVMATKTVSTTSVPTPKRTKRDATADPLAGAWVGPPTGEAIAKDLDKLRRSVTEGVSTLASPPLVEPHRSRSDETRCVCGQRWRDHQGGASQRLAVATNCRTFRPV
jgi:hypothetical protein